MYATTQDFINNFSEKEMITLTNLENAGATAINEAVLQANQNKACALIDGMIAGCSEVALAMPFVVVPTLLIGYELDLVRYYLDRNLAREDVRQRYEDAIAQLKLIGQCKMSLGLVGNPAEPLVTGGAVSYQSNGNLADSSFFNGF